MTSQMKSTYEYSRVVCVGQLELGEIYIMFSINIRK